MNRTRIEYLDFTWNPLVGCRGVGCAVRDVCWARRQAKRMKHRCNLCYQFIPHIHRERYNQPCKVKKPARIGTVFMGDFCDAGFDDSVNLVRRILYLYMEQAYWHTFIILTKQPQNIKLAQPLPKNVWLGVSVNKQEDVWRIGALKCVDTKIKFVSFEPLYEKIDCNLGDINWVIIGGQTRPTLLPKPEWIEQIVAECDKRNIPVFLKNNLGLENPRQEFPMNVAGGD